MKLPRAKSFWSIASAVVTAALTVPGASAARAWEAPRLDVLKTYEALDTAGDNHDGAGPYSRAVWGDDGMLYGMTNGGYGASNGGGASGNGVVYRFNPATREYKVLHAFSALDSTGTYNADGAVGGIDLIRGPDGAFYGQTQYGGEGGSGTVFRITADGKFTVLHTYSPVAADGTNADGANPLRSLLFGDDGNLYGTTRLGGPNTVNGRGLGVAWMMHPHGGAFTVIHAFTAAEGHAASLVKAHDGYFYGCAVWPSVAAGTGTLFRMAPGYYETLHAFAPADANGANADGADCYEPLLEHHGALYGSTTYGGAHGTGTVFRYDLAAAKVEVLHSFAALDADGANADGANPQARLVRGPHDALYSTADVGGSGATGVVYRWSEEGFKVLHAFPAVNTAGNNTEGAYPAFGVLTHDEGCEADRDALYGAAANGGADGNGTLYRLDLSR